MESLPGKAPEPAWAAALRWPCSPPFFIKWFKVARGNGTPFRLVGHLKNSLNENRVVLVGRDGQEIEEDLSNPFSVCSECKMNILRLFVGI